VRKLLEKQLTSPFLMGNEHSYILKAYKVVQLTSDGHFTNKCQRWLEKNLGTKEALINHLTNNFLIERQRFWRVNHNYALFWCRKI